MTEDGRSREVRKSETPEQAGSRKSGASEEENTSEIENKFEIQKQSEIEYPTSEIKPLQTANSKLQTETMEVHHHPEIEKKGLKEYLLEGLMIFLAVTMGFFAESYREHLGDRAKEIEYMRSMVQDLRADTTEIRRSEKDFKLTCSVIDTMLTCLKSDRPDPAIINRAVSNYFWTYTGFSYNNHTVQQLKSSGNFRLVQDKAVADSILKYDNIENAFILNQYNDLKGTLMTYKNIEAKVIYYKDLNNLNTDIRGFSPTDFARTSKPAFVTTDKELLSSYYNSLFIHEALCHTFLSSLKRTHTRAARLITFIKKEYNLEDE